MKGWVKNSKVKCLTIGESFHHELQISGNNNVNLHWALCLCKTDNVLNLTSNPGPNIWATGNQDIKPVNITAT